MSGSNLRWCSWTRGVLCALPVFAVGLPGALFAAEVTVTNAADSGNGSLRQAILFANTNFGVDTVKFRLPGAGPYTISLASGLPPLTDAVVIDGTTQPGFAGKPIVELNGAAAGPNSGLRLLAGNSAVLGLVINRFGGEGIRIEGLGTNVILGNYIGCELAGTAARPNQGQGIYVLSSRGNLIGGSDSGERNVISGNSGAGIFVQSGSSNWIVGNLIGTTASGTAALGNGFGGTNNGIVLYDSGANRVGGTNSGARNVISGNHGSGVYIYGARATGNSIQGNFIGTDVTGRLVISNAADGISVASASANLIGGSGPGEGNLLSGNGKAGVSLAGPGVENNWVRGNLIGTDASGLAALGNTLAGVSINGAHSNVVGTASGSRNVISGNKQDGILITNAWGNLAQGNFVGVDASGSNALPNGFNGVTMLNAISNRIGGTSPAARNVLSGNMYHGLQLAASARGNLVQGNFVGLDASGNSAVPNRVSGLWVESDSNFIGTSEPGGGNIISGNATNGLSLEGVGASNNIVQGNLVGTDPAGTRTISNAWCGIGLAGGARNNLIGGTALGSGNLISGNGNAGFSIIGLSSRGNLVQGNKMGTDISGTQPLGNTFEGIYLERSQSNLFGGTVNGAGNLVSGNKTSGVWLNGSSWNAFMGNLLGTRADGTTGLGNLWHTIESEIGSTNNTIGGGPGAGNVVAFAQRYAGVRIRAGSLNNAILGNSIFANNALGVDLGNVGVLANDNCDSDSGANRHQNYPVLTDALSGTGVGVRGSFSGPAGQSFLIQFFASPAADPSGWGEGEIYLGDKTVVTGPDCTVRFSANFSASIAPGFMVTATATDLASNNTSEFSQGLMVVPAPVLSAVLSGTNEVAISWVPGSATSLVLKRTVSLSPPVFWTVVRLPVAQENGRFVVRVLLTEQAEFFALGFE
jgi:hypothetical protein